MTVEGTVTILLDRQKASVPRVENETLLESAGARACRRRSAARRATAAPA